MEHIKRRIILLMLSVIGMLLTICSASSAEQTKQGDNNLFKLTIKMESLRREGKWLEAMDSATLILTIDDNYRSAVDYVHRYWDITMRKTEEQLERLNDEHSLKQAEERCEIYRLLDEVHNNLRSVRLPLYGQGKKWVWQPEVGYYSGHYDNERRHVVGLLYDYAKQALKSYNTEEAGLYYDMALHKYMLTEGERKSNKRLIVEHCRGVIEYNTKTDKLYNQIFAYDLCAMLLKIDPMQTDLLERQQQIRQTVAALYLQGSEAALVAGDTIEAEQMRLSYEEWKINEYDEENIY